MKFRGMALALLVAALGFMSTVGCARQRTYITTFKDQGKRGWLGVQLQDVTGRLKEKKHLTVDAGAYVTDVVEDSPAEEAGLKEGDVIVKLDGKEIEDSDDLTKAVQRTKPKTEVKLDIVRGSEKKSLTAKLGRSSAPRAFSFDFDGHDAPGIPRTPMGPHLFYQNETNGLEVQSLSKQLAEYFEVPDREGLLITSVEKGSSAEKAGFKAGDVLTKVESDRIRDVDELRDALRDNEDKDVKCIVIRKGKSTNLTWHLEAEDDDGLSYDIPTPHAMPYHVRPFRMGPLHLNLDNLKEEMRDLKRHLKENMLEFKRDIRAEVSGVY